VKSKGWAILFLTSVSCLSPDTNLLTRSDFSDGFSVVIGLAASNSHSQTVDTETSISAGFSISASNVRILFPGQFLLPESRRNFDHPIPVT